MILKSDCQNFHELPSYQNCWLCLSTTVPGLAQRKNHSGQCQCHVLSPSSLHHIDSHGWMDHGACVPWLGSLCKGRRVGVSAVHAVQAPEQVEIGCLQFGCHIAVSDVALGWMVSWWNGGKWVTWPGTEEGHAGWWWCHVLSPSSLHCVDHHHVSHSEVFIVPHWFLLDSSRIWSIPGIPDESNLAELPAKLIKQFQWNVAWNSNSARIIPGIMWMEWPTECTGMELLLQMTSKSSVGSSTTINSLPQPPPPLSATPTHCCHHHQWLLPPTTITHHSQWPWQEQHGNAMSLAAASNECPRCHVADSDMATKWWTTSNLLFVIFICDIPGMYPPHHSVCWHQNEVPHHQWWQCGNQVMNDDIDCCSSLSSSISSQPPPHHTTTTMIPPPHTMTCLQPQHHHMRPMQQQQTTAMPPWPSHITLPLYFLGDKSRCHGIATWQPDDKQWHLLSFIII